MTSLQILPPIPQTPHLTTDWGTGGPGVDEDKRDKTVDRAATFTYRRVPIKQFYDLTSLKRSNVRTNDQLLPQPESSEMLQDQIRTPFPAEHPYTSHMPRMAIFPKYGESPDDPVRGVEAKRRYPKNAEIPSKPYEVKVIQKTKGFPLRHELVKIPPDSERDALEWPSDQYHHLVKTGTDDQQYFPIPPKVLIPNLEERPAEIKINARTANALRNVEREQWRTTYDLNNTGYGPSNPDALDNYDNKMKLYRETGDIDDTLYPRSIPTFDPPRPVEGRIARNITPKPDPQVVPGNGEASTYKRKATASEVSEDLLLNGREYVNLPEGYVEDYPVINPHVERGLKAVEEARAKLNRRKEVPAWEPHKESYLEALRQEEKERYANMEAQNRWKVLQLEKSEDDINQLRHKHQAARDDEQAGVFYNHEGKFQTERAGLYKTSYETERFTTRLEQEKNRPSNMFNTNTFGRNWDIRTEMNSTAAAASAGSRTMQPTNPSFSGRLGVNQYMDPYEEQRYQQEMQLKPTVQSANPRMQENGFIQTESTYGNGYNTEKFLQGNDLMHNNRTDPTSVISHHNQMLDNVKPYTLNRSVTFADNVMVATGAGEEPIRLSSAPINDTAKDHGITTRQYVSTHAQFRPDEELENPEAESNEKMGRKLVTFAGYPVLYRSDSMPVLNERTNKIKHNSLDLFTSKSTNFIPAGVASYDESKSATQAQYESVYDYNLNYKDDARFKWDPKSGSPRPQTKLLKIQESFSKSNARKEFNKRFAETNPDLRHHQVHTAKRHDFYGFNAQELRGN